jgi:hypothetical protein
MDVRGARCAGGRAKMEARGSLATLSLIVGIVCADSGCTAPAGQDDPSGAMPAKDEPLDITVDSLDIVHGALRLSATMVDGAAGVSVRLGGDCEHREVGGGVSTLSSLVWALGDSDVAQAIGCGLVVRAPVRDGARYVNKVAELAVGVDVAALESDGADDAPRLQAVTASKASVSLVFSSVRPSARLITCDSALEAAAPEAEDESATAGDGTSQFLVPPVDLARAVLRRRPLTLDGASFAPSLSVGGASLQSDAQQEG